MSQPDEQPQNEGEQPTESNEEEQPHVEEEQQPESPTIVSPEMSPAGDAPQEEHPSPHVQEELENVVPGQPAHIDEAPMEGVRPD